jgi:hypothetical protein
MFAGTWIFSIVITLVVVGVSLFFVFRVLGGLHKAAKEEQRLLQTGTPASGQILAVNQTGTYVNNQPQVNIVVMVYPSGGQPYQAQITKLVSMFEIAQYQIGGQVQVYYDPQDPSKIAVATQAQMMAANPGMMPPMTGTPPLGGGYPPQGGGYPPQGGGYPPQGGGPPPQGWG